MNGWAISQDSAGLVSALVFFLLAVVVGQGAQLLKLIRRQRLIDSGELSGEAATDSMSVFYILIGCVSLTIVAWYGATRAEFDHWIVWVRLPAIALTASFLWWIGRDLSRTYKRSAFSSWAWFAVGAFAAALFAAGLIAVPLLGRGPLLAAKPLIEILVLTVAMPLNCAGKLAQAWKVTKAGKLGGASILREVGEISKELTLLAYVLTLGSDAVHLIVSNCISLAVMAVLLAAMLYVRSSERRAGG